jgi:predicted nucleotide-binding protein
LNLLCSLVNFPSEHHTLFVEVVHGHDSEPKWELVRMVKKKFKLEAIILDEQADMGRTIIEKFEDAAELPGYAFVLLTPDDIGGENRQGKDLGDISTSNFQLKDLDINFKPRARQNVILELGYFFAKLGRKRVCCLYKSGVEIPSDISGVIYKEFIKSVKEKEGEIRRELRAVGYDV